MLIIDEVQLTSRLSAIVKELWDEDARSDIDPRVVLTGSSPILLQRGLSEGLTWWFEMLRSIRWEFSECQDGSNTRLMASRSSVTATYGRNRDFLLVDPERKGHLEESAVGAYLPAQPKKKGNEVHWW